MRAVKPNVLAAIEAGELPKVRQTTLLIEDEIDARLAKWIYERRVKKDYQTLSRAVNRALDKFLTMEGY